VDSPLSWRKAGEMRRTSVYLQSPERHCIRVLVTRKESVMDCRVLRSIGLLVLFLLITDGSFGATAAVVPLSASDGEQVDQDHGLLRGTNHFTIGFIRNEQGQSPDFKHSNEMEWHIEEVTHGKRSLTVQLPVDGAFVVRLPVGSYRVTKMRFRSSGGSWHGVLPTAFEIRPWECTSLGTSMLQMQVGFVTGWISRHVLNEQEHTDAHHDPLFGGKRCSASMAKLGSSVRHPVKLDRYEAKK